MDLGAYIQIGELSDVAKRNGIEVDRIRGYRLMGQEDPVTDEEISNLLRDVMLLACQDFLNASPAFTINPYWGYEYSDRTKRRREKYMIHDDSGKPIGFRWDKFHGKRRKNLKYLIKKRVKQELEQWGMWNKYAGRDDVLYIHAKQGSSNWSGTYWWDYMDETWFLDACDDSDAAYCDIYARIDPITKEVE